MSVSLNLLKAAGQHFDLLPGHEDREFSLSNVNAAAVLDALHRRRLLRTSMADPLLPRAPHRRPAQAPRTGSPAIRVTEMRNPRTMLVIDCGRAEGYIEQKRGQLSYLVNEGVEIGALMWDGAEPQSSA
jgi:hypothetical protein